MICRADDAAEATLFFVSGGHSRFWFALVFRSTVTGFQGVGTDLGLRNAGYIRHKLVLFQTRHHTTAHITLHRLFLINLKVVRIFHPISLSNGIILLILLSPRLQRNQRVTLLRIQIKTLQFHRVWILSRNILKVRHALHI